MANDILQKQFLNPRKLIGLGLLIWIACASAFGQINHWTPYKLAAELFSGGGYLTTSLFAALLMALSYACILLEPKKGRILWPLSRILIICDIFVWFCMAFQVFVCGYGASYDLSFRFAVWAYSFPLTTLVAYWIVGIIPMELLRKVLFTIICVVLPLLHYYAALDAARFGLDHSSPSF